MKLRSRGIVIVVLILLLVSGFLYWRVYYRERVIKSEVENEIKDSIFVHASKQYAFKIPENYSVSEPTGGRQTLAFPNGRQISGGDLKSLIDQDVVIIETAINKKSSFEALISEIETQTKKNDAVVKVDPVDYGKLKGSSLIVQAKTNHRQIMLNTPTVIILTCKIDHPKIEEMARSITIDLSPYAEQISKATGLMRDTRQKIADAKFGEIYGASSENLKKMKTEEEFSNLLKDIGPEFNNNVLIWGIYFNPKGIGTAVNIVEQDKIIRRGTFFYAKDKSDFHLDGLRLTGKLDKKVNETETTKKK